MDILRSDELDAEGLSADQVREWMNKECREWHLEGKKLLLIVPDQTRTAPLGVVFKAFCNLWLDRVQMLDVMIALGTHPPMSEGGICKRLELSTKERLPKPSESSGWSAFLSSSKKQWHQKKDVK